MCRGGGEIRVVRHFASLTSNLVYCSRMVVSSSQVFKNQLHK